MSDEPDVNDVQTWRTVLHNAAVIPKNDPRYEDSQRWSRVALHNINILEQGPNRRDRAEAQDMGTGHAAALGVARGMSMGASDLFQNLVLSPDELESVETTASEHPTATTAGEFVGAAIPFVAGGGLGAGGLAARTGIGATEGFGLSRGQVGDKGLSNPLAGMVIGGGLAAGGPIAGRFLGATAKRFLGPTGRRLATAIRGGPRAPEFPNLKLDLSHAPAPRAPVEAPPFANEPHVPVASSAPTTPTRGLSASRFRGAEALGPRPVLEETEQNLMDPGGPTPRPRFLDPAGPPPPDWARTPLRDLVKRPGAPTSPVEAPSRPGAPSSPGGPAGYASHAPIAPQGAAAAGTPESMLGDNLRLTARALQLVKGPATRAARQELLNVLGRVSPGSAKMLTDAASPAWRAIPELQSVFGGR